MKKSMYLCLFVLTAIVSTSSVPKAIPSIDLVGTKWMSPITEECYDYLCFNSEKNVQFFHCEYEVTLEVGYTINGSAIEVNAYGSSSRSPESMLILYMDNGVLRQRPNPENTYPRTFIKMPIVGCE